MQYSCLFILLLLFCTRLNNNATVLHLATAIRRYHSFLLFFTPVFLPIKPSPLFLPLFSRLSNLYQILSFNLFDRFVLILPAFAVLVFLYQSRQVALFQHTHSLSLSLSLSFCLSISISIFYTPRITFILYFDSSHSFNTLLFDSRNVNKCSLSVLYKSRG